jgi:hypothetical protein
MHLHPQRLLHSRAVLLLLGLLLASEGLAGVRWGNGLKTQPIVFNALTTDQAASSRLATVPLASSSFVSSPELQLALYDPAARIVMKYLVSCALQSTQQVQWWEHTTGKTYTWRGDMGLCPQWGSGAPSQECLERVSSCVLARNNPLGVRVRISLRGQVNATTAPALLLQSVAGPDTYTDPTSTLSPPGVLIDSFKSCAASPAGSDCGWQPLAVGTCSSGAQVNILSTLSSWSHGVLRACVGSRGCNSSSPEFLSQSSPASTGPLLLSLTCPASGQFSLQVHSWTGSLSWLQLSSPTSPTPARFIAERELFPVREGAFYGLILGASTVRPGLRVYVNGSTYRVHMQWGTESYFKWPAASQPSDPEVDEIDGEWYRLVGRVATKTLPSISGSVYPQMFACADPTWASQATYLPKRLCALPDSSASCASVLVGTCRRSTTALYGMCQSQDGPGATGDGDFYGCWGGSQYWYRSLTTYLLRACDLVGTSGTSCL